jgi:hypothetical protein
MHRPWWFQSKTYGPPPFSPLDIAGLTVWLDASVQTLGQTDEDPVTQWDDLSGNNYHFILNNQPALVKNGAGDTVNGLGVLGFNGTDSSYKSSVLDFNTLSAATVFIVLKNDADPGVTGGGIWYTGADFNTHSPFTDGNIYDGFGSTVRKTVGDPATTLAQWNIYEVVTGLNDWRAYLNGVNLFTTAVNTVGFGSGIITLGNSITYTWQGRMAEVLIYNSKLSDPDRTLIEAYLTTKWGL